MRQNSPEKKTLTGRIIGFFTPPPGWRFTVVILLGIVTGLGFYILYISNAASYLSDDPRACVNCHVMNTEFATWEHSSHGRAATCNGCHVPHDNFIRKYMFKASDGLRHATMFTFRLEPQVIHIKEAGAGVVQENCIRCHSPIVQNVSIRKVTYGGHMKGEGPVCWSCHRETPHGKVRSLASTPYARVPKLSPVVPEWLNRVLVRQKEEQTKKQ